MCTFVGGENVGAGLACHGFDVNKVAVVVVDDQHVGVARDGWLDESAGEVGEDFAGVGGKVGIKEMQFVVGGLSVGLGWRVVGIVVCKGGEDLLQLIPF